MGYHTRLTMFIIAGLTHDPQLKVVLFIFLLFTYLLSIPGNMIIITLTLLDPHLKTPICFFLWNFSLLETSLTTTYIPNLLVMMATGDKIISYNFLLKCLFAFLLGASEFYLLAAMSYDHYVAICKPLHYTTIMNSKICIQLVFCSWLAGFFTIFIPLLLGLHLDFRVSNIIHYFYCGTTALPQMSCSDTQLIKMVRFISASVTLLVTLLMVIISYIYIALTIPNIPSTNQRIKAFTICSSHRIVISLSRGSCNIMCFKPSVKQSISFSKGIALLNTCVAPLLNPFVYSLRNQQVKKAFMNMIHRVVSFSNK
ncbi:olfactory receptor 6C74-like [Hippopotamus amphibius kiboko]|uniref:olfactory receptor 6C74-like n=1 Tax=Hippopotamus amphibius kiboko TaxID=575201 RepID=UPI002592FAE9|nr:olfactory receptor 6C74-like [Hippopotamus amphibius kiboko]